MLHQIGAGVLGPVYRAYQPDPGRLVAVKQFRLDLPPERALRFIAALDRLIAADLTHLGIAAPLAAGLVDASPYLALDFVAADSFDVMIRDYGPMPTEEAVRIAGQMAAALDAAASLDVFHGTLHPRDVLVSAQDTRLTGLGIAQALDELAIVPPLRRPYAAPERVAGLAWDRRADIYSLAALAYEMVSGRRLPGNGRDVVDAMEAPDTLATPTLRATFSRGLAEDPVDRFDTALAFVESLQHALADEPPAARATARHQRRDEVLPDLPVPSPGVAAATPTVGTRADEASAASVDDVADHPAAIPHDARARPALESSAADPPPAIVAEVVSGGSETATLDVHGDTDREPEADSAAIDTVNESAVADQTHDIRVDALHGVDALHMHAAPVLRSAAAERSVHDIRGDSAIWPIALALMVGLLVGFAGGYGFGARERSVVSVTADASAASTSTGASASGTPPVAGTAPAPAAGAAPVVPAPALTARAPSVSAVERAASAGRLVVRSTPDGARVLLDGREVGLTPMTLRDLARGAHVLRIAHQGYVTAERRVRISTAQPAQSIEVDLVANRAGREAAPPAAAERSRGSLMVDSRPGGARVLVDGKRMGTTPLVLESVTVGQHSVRIELERFRTWTSSVKVVAGERARVSGSLER